MLIKSYKLIKELKGLHKDEAISVQSFKDDVYKLLLNMSENELNISHLEIYNFYDRKGQKTVYFDFWVGGENYSPGGVISFHKEVKSFNSINKDLKEFASDMANEFGKKVIVKIRQHKIPYEFEIAGDYSFWKSEPKKKIEQTKEVEQAKNIYDEKSR